MQYAIEPRNAIDPVLTPDSDHLEFKQKRPFKINPYALIGISAFLYDACFICSALTREPSDGFGYFRENIGHYVASTAILVGSMIASQIKKPIPVKALPQDLQPT